MRLTLIGVMQIYLLRPHPEVMSNRQLKSLVQQALVTDVVVENESAWGNPKATGDKQAFSAEKLKTGGLRDDPNEKADESPAWERD